MREIPYLHESGLLPPTLARVPFLAKFDSPQLDQLLSNAVILDCDPGDVIIEEGHGSKFLCILLRGSVSVVKGGVSIATIKDAGEVFGELAVLNDEARTASVVAVTPVFCLRIDPGFLDRLSDAERSGFYAVIYRFINALLADRLEECNRRVTAIEKELATLKGARYRL